VVFEGKAFATGFVKSDLFPSIDGNQTDLHKMKLNTKLVPDDAIAFSLAGGLLDIGERYVSIFQETKAGIVSFRLDGAASISQHSALTALRQQLPSAPTLAAGQKSSSWPVAQILRIDAQSKGVRPQNLHSHHPKVDYLKSLFGDAR
jgi:hypothetical protein